ncbi:MAG: polysaccharide biosynthesis C-terminal domain-containing protein [Hominimerdicola sp.]
MKKQSFLKGSAILLGMVVITKILGLMYKIPLTHILGGTGMGYFSSAFSVFTPVMAIVVSGIPSTMARLTAENYALGRYRNLRKLRKTALLVFGCMGLIATVVMVLISSHLAKAVINENGAKYALICVAPSVLFCAIMSVERGYFEGLQNMLPTAISEIVETVFKLVLGLGFAFFISDYAQKQFNLTGRCFGVICSDSAEVSRAALPYIAGGAILGSSLASGIACIYIFISGKINGDGITKERLAQDEFVDRTSHTIKLLYRFSLPLALISVITTLTNMIDMLTINPCLSQAISSNPEPFKQYINDNVTVEMLPNFIYGSYTGLAVTIFGLVPTLTAMFGKSILPSLTEAWAMNNKCEVSKNLNRMMIISSFIAIPSGIGISALAYEILEFLFSGRTDEIVVSTQPLQILGVGVIFMSISLPCFSILQTLGKPRKVAGIMVFSGVIKLVLNIVLIRIPEIGINGAAIATTAANFFICVSSVRSIYKLMDTKCCVKEVYVKPAYAGILCGATALLANEFLKEQTFFNIPSRLSLLICIAFGSIIYFFSLCLLCEMPKNVFNLAISKKNAKNP